MSVRWLLWSTLGPSQVLLGTEILDALLLALGRHKIGCGPRIITEAAIVFFGLLPMSHNIVYQLKNRFPQPILPS